VEGMTAPIEQKLLEEHNNCQIAKIDVTQHGDVSGGKNSLEKHWW